MEKIDIIRIRILKILAEIKEDETRTELAVLFGEYDAAIRKLLRIRKATLLDLQAKDKN